MSERGPEEDFGDRLSAVEQQQRADRRALGSLDADVSDLQAQRRQDVRLLQSLRDTQIEHGARLGGLESGLERLRSDVSAGFADVGGRLEAIVANPLEPSGLLPGARIQRKTRPWSALR